MATINGTTSHSNWSFKLEVAETATSVAGNTSTVKVDVYIGRLNSASYMWGAEIPVTVKCTGVTNKTFTYKEPDRVNFSAGQWLKIGSVTFTGVPHNSDGSKTVTISASFTNNIEPSKGSASGSFKLTTIARASQPSCITYPSHTQNVGDFGDTIVIHMNRQASTFTHRVRYAFGTSAGTCVDADTGEEATTVTDNVRWVIPEALMYLIPKTTSGSGTIYVDTYNGDEHIGTKSCEFTASVPASVKPSVSVKLEDVTGVGDIYGNPVQGLSKIKASITARVAYNAPIVFTSLNIDGAKFTQGSGSYFGATTGVLPNAGSARPVTVAVRDARGRMGSASYDMTVYAYAPPSISLFKAHRCDSAGEPDDEGGYILVEFSAAITSLSNKNTATYTIRYKKTTEDSWTTWELTGKTNVYNVSNSGWIFQADSNSSYDVELEAKDRHGTDKKRTSISTAFSLINFHPDGTGFAFGKVAEKSNTLSIALEAEVYAPIKLAEEDKLTLELTEDFRSYGGYSSNQPWCRHNAAGLVEVHGVVSPTKASNTLNSDTATTICQLPAGYRPAVGFCQICQGNGADLWLATVDPDGTVSASRYRSGGTFTQPSTSAWLPFHLVFMPDQ